MSTEESNIPYGCCQCGCGEKTAIATTDWPKYGHVKGKPKRFKRGHGRRKGPVDYLVEDRGYSTPCWIWQRCIQPNGYGKKWDNGSLSYAHRVYYERACGVVPEGLEIDHLCNQRSCVNPEHLEAVTELVNQRRAVRRLRGVARKLDWDRVREMRKLYKSGAYTQAELGKLFSVSECMVGLIILGKAWRE